MGKEVVFDVKPGEILKEGKMQTVNIFKNATVNDFPDKYAITENGIWLEQKGLFGNKAVFAPFSGFKNYAVMNGCCILYPSSGGLGSTPTYIYFADTLSAIAIIEKYVAKLTM